jgi:hypothetical protein
MLVRWCRRALGLLVLAFGLKAGISTVASTQEAVYTVEQLLQMTGPQLEAVYRQGTSVGLPAGRVKGTAILAPGTRRNRLMARGTRLVWQGKVVDPDQSIAVNRFFGLPVVKGRLYQAESWLDGAPSLILDYSQTSRIYAQNRDEIRQIAPNLYLGLMYGRTEPQPTLKMYFVLETQP